NAEQRYFRPAVMNRSIRGGRLSLTNYVWFPYENGVRRFRDAASVKAAAPHYFQRYLEPRKHALSKRRGMARRWWEPIWPRLDLSGPKLVTTYYGSVGAFAFDESDSYA